MSKIANAHFFFNLQSKIYEKALPKGEIINCNNKNNYTTGLWSSIWKCYRMPVKTSNKIRGFFVWGLSSHSRIFHSYGDVTLTGNLIKIRILERNKDLILIRLPLPLIFCTVYLKYRLFFYLYSSYIYKSAHLLQHKA